MKAHCFKSVVQIRDEDGVRHREVDLRVNLLQVTDVNDRVLNTDQCTTLLHT